jgi:hypothetical protein
MTANVEKVFRVPVEVISSSGQTTQTNSLHHVNGCVAVFQFFGAAPLLATVIQILWTSLALIALGVMLLLLAGFRYARNEKRARLYAELSSGYCIQGQTFSTFSERLTRCSSTKLGEQKGELPVFLNEFRIY